MNSIFEDYSIQISTPDMFTPPEDLLHHTGHTWHGAAIMWHSSLDSQVSSLKTTNERFTSIRITNQDLNLLCISVYFPTSGKDEEFLEMSTDLTNFVNDHQKEDETVLIGTDSNCSENSTPRRILALSNFSRELNLMKITTCKPTFHHHNGSSQSNIDYFFISKKSAPMLTNLKSLCTLDSPENLSSHDPVTATLHLSTKVHSAANTDYSDTFTDFTQEKVIWDTTKLAMYQDTVALALTQYDAMFPLPEHIPLKCELFSNLLVKSGEMTMELKPVKKKNKSRMKLKPSPSLHQAWQKLQKAFKIWKSNGKIKNLENVNYLNYKQARALFQCRYRKEADLKFIRENNAIILADKNNKNDFYKLIKNMRSRRMSKSPTTLNTPAGTYYGASTLEGFTVDAEILGQAEGESAEYDNEFYKLCILDNLYIFEFKGDEAVKIPAMTMDNLEYILMKDMKPRKACDYYKLTVEHLRHAGLEAKTIILKLLNSIIQNIYYLTCPQVKIGLSTPVYKGKGKPVASSNSYRRITVTPQIGSMIDRYIDPIAENIFLKVQSSDQLGFTKHVSYLMAAVERGECQRYALDTKQTCYGVSFDGQAAFPSVDRDILVRELYSCGETGDILLYSNNTYQNTVSHLKQDGKLGRQIREFKGSRQGHKRAAGHFKSYINPCLTVTNSSELGFWIGPICVSCICVADDTYILSADPRQLQGLINIVGHYSRRYRVIFGADKTKVTITGSKHDMAYYKDINLWSLHGTPLKVAENNDHLGLIVSGLDEETKNIDKNIDSARKTLFDMMGNIFAYKCKLSPTVLHHVWSIYVNPVLRSGLAALPVRPVPMKTLSNFHHKVLRGILKLSKVSPIAPLYFLLGELPVEALVHLDALSLFWCIWSNPQTKIHEITKYLLMMSDSSSLTWAAHIRLLFQLYNLPDPLTLISGTPWPKERWRLTTKTAITIYWELSWRGKAASNSKLSFLNVQVTGLSGKTHPVLSGILSTQEVERSRIHVKMLAGDYCCYSYMGSDRLQDAYCRLCQLLHHEHPAPVEDMVHLLTRCIATRETRTRLLSDLLNEISLHFPNNKILEQPNHLHLTQLILDPTSLNLPISIRISPDHPALTIVLNVCRSLCFAVHKDRTRQLKKLQS